MRIKIAFVLISVVSSLLFFQNCGGSLDYGAYNQDLSSQSAAPVILQFDQGPIQLIEGEPLSLAVVVPGADLQFQWYKNDLAINNANDRSFDINSVTRQDQGTYKVVVMNSAGEDQASVEVLVDLAPTPSPQPTSAPSPTPVASPTPQPKPVCEVHYQAKNDGGISPIAKNGNYALYKGGGSKECDSGGCGIRMGVSCTSGDEIRLTYQYKFFSRSANLVTTPWSGLTGSIKWGVYSQIYQPGHVTDECEAPLLCGINVSVETKSGQTCRIGYQFTAEGFMRSPVRYDGVWSHLPDMGGRDKNCDDGYCGMRAFLTCP